MSPELRKQIDDYRDAYTKAWREREGILPEAVTCGCLARVIIQPTLPPIFTDIYYNGPIEPGSHVIEWD